ncbi:nuclear transport factor 2 family protein [Novosphingobium terrae]|uniref:nuclear transport factor 2 family protein n=1 Tax=Novosphingobium terrae TaxID=2726189 RepID=UPI00197E298F|nr:nuclear transport factor 2 family protein [Novosphingobium terrae]
MFRQRLIPPLAALALCGIAAPALAQTAAPSAASAALIALEDARFKAQVDQNLPALTKAIAPGALYIHANGVLQSGEQYLHDVQTGASRYRAIEASERSAEIIGNIAITHALVKLHVGADAVADKTITARTTGVYVKQGGAWLVKSWQSTVVPPAAPAK